MTEVEKHLKAIQYRLNRQYSHIEFRKDVRFDTIHATISYAITREQWIVPATTLVYRDGKRVDQPLGGSRSLHDLYLLCKHYHEGVTIFKVRDALDVLLRTGCYNYWMCYTHRRMMFAREYGYSDYDDRHYLQSHYGMQLCQIF